MPVIYLGLGSNLGHSEEILSDVLNLFQCGAQFELQTCSSFYRSKPLEEMQQPDYINAVARLHTELTGRELLGHLQQIETRFGRTRTDERWTSRTLDLDILLYGDQQIIMSDLIVPHPGLLQRDFVLYPLYEIAPEIEIPGFGPISNALQTCKNRGLEKLNEYHCKS